ACLSLLFTPLPLHLLPPLLCSPVLSFPRPHFILFFFNHTSTTEIYTLSLHDALPIFIAPSFADIFYNNCFKNGILPVVLDAGQEDRKSTRLNSSHVKISYAVFCLKKKKREM